MKKRLLALTLCVALICAMIPDAMADTTQPAETAAETTASTVSVETTAPEKATVPTETTAPEEPEPTATETAAAAEPTVEETESVSTPTEETLPEEEPEVVSRILTAATSSHIGIQVSGALPENVTLQAGELEMGTVLLNDSGSQEAVVFAVDVSLQQGEEEWQPSSIGTRVTLTFDVSGKGLSDGDMVTLTHIHQDEEPRQYTYVVMDQKLTFFTDRFSVFIVSKKGDTTGSPIYGNTTMTVGQTQTFYWPNTGRETGCVWTVTDTEKTVSYTVYDYGGYHGSNNGETWDYNAPWITVTALHTGSVTLKMETKTGNGEESFTISIVAPEGFHVENRVAESGCLMPAWDEDTDSRGYTYKWTRSDGQSIYVDALTGDGGVNVSIDRGGVTNARLDAPITYTVTACDANGEPVKDKDGNSIQASYRVLYGNVILNPGFETPVVDTQRTLYNGYEGLYWMTTAPGSMVGKPSQDIEIATVKNHNQQSIYHFYHDAAEGSQFAELNAEAAGTLYQDMLTTPGASLDWSFSHAARAGGSNKMYIVIGATRYAREIVNNEDVKALLRDANGNIPDASTGEDGLRFEHNGGTYYIWQHESKTNDIHAWTNIFGSYAVPENQYLTRLFFAADPDSGTPTIGNFIDAVEAGEYIRYKIAYYLNDGAQADRTVTGRENAYSTVALSDLQGYLEQGYVITEVNVNGSDYPGDIRRGLYLTTYRGESDEGFGITLNIHLSKTAITVTKVVEIEGWEALSTQEREKLIGDGYQASFGLYQGQNQVATAGVKITSVGLDTLTALCAFENVALNQSYTIRELDAGTLEDYQLSGRYFREGDRGTDDSISVTLTTDSPTAAVTCTNEYSYALTELTVAKSGALASDAAQSFLFHVAGPDGFSMDVAVQGNGRVTIRGLKTGGLYTVTEKEDWSWRYKAEKGAKTVTLTAGGNTVIFDNTRKNGQWLSGDNFKENQFARNENEEKG